MGVFWVPKSSRWLWMRRAVPVTHPHTGRPLLGRVFGEDRLGAAPELHDVAEADTGPGLTVVVVLEDGGDCNTNLY